MPGDAPEMPPEFVRLVEECERLAELRTTVAVSDRPAAVLDRVDAQWDTARAALYAWHRAEVERARNGEREVAAAQRAAMHATIREWRDGYYRQVGEVERLKAEAGFRPAPGQRGDG